MEVKCDMLSLPGTSEKERTGCTFRKSERGIFKFSHQTQTQETSIHKKGQPGRKVQVCLFTCQIPPSFWDVPYFLIFLFSFLFYWSQFPGAAICHTPRKQTTQELYIQNSLPSGQHPKVEAHAETETWVSGVITEGQFGSLPRCQIGLWHVCSDSRWKAWGCPPLTLRQAIVQQLSARTGPQQWFWRGKGVCLSRVGCAAF